MLVRKRAGKAMARDYVTHALADARIIELRHHAGDRWVSGLFDDPVALWQALQAAGEIGNCYTSLNAPGDVTVTNAMTSRALRDDDILAIVRLPLDFDPVRPIGVPSTDAELRHAARQRDRLVSVLTAVGWPRPAIAVSGNGAHALYRCRLPASPDTRE